jgi:tetratricopeptide (TPR) repeat protein
MTLTTRSLATTTPRSRLIALGALLAAFAVAALASWPPQTTPRAGAAANVAAHPGTVQAAAIPAGDLDRQLAEGAAALQRARETFDPAAYGQAEDIFNAVLRADPENIQALIGVGSIALSRHEFAEALAIGQQALALNDSIASIYGVIGDAQVELGRYPQAVDTVQRMVDLRPDLASYSRVSYLRELHGDLPGAIDAMQRAVAAAGPATENTEYVRVQLGNLHFAAGDLDAAAEIYRQALDRLPDYHLALAGLARVAASRGDLPGAIALFERAKARLPLPETIIGLGDTLEAAGRMDDAADEYALAEAMQRLNAANGFQVDLELAGFFADHGDARVAVRLARIGYGQRPTVFAADTLAWALFRDGRLHAAAGWLHQSLRLGTQSSRLLYHAGTIEAAAGKNAAARRHLRAALRLNAAFSPLDAPRAAAALERLGR